MSTCCFLWKACAIITVFSTNMHHIIMHFTHFCTSITYWHENIIQCAYIFHPTRNEHSFSSNTFCTACNHISYDGCILKYLNPKTALINISNWAAPCYAKPEIENIVWAWVYLSAMLTAAQYSCKRLWSSFAFSWMKKKLCFRDYIIQQDEV